MTRYYMEEGRATQVLHAVSHHIQYSSLHSLLTVYTKCGKAVL